jgi:hypothetical protein
VFHAAIPGSRVTVDVPWSPYDIDGRNYDWAGLADAADLLFIMAYDTQSQVRPLSLLMICTMTRNKYEVVCIVYIAWYLQLQMIW